MKFSTYAVTIILGEIKRFFRDDGIVKIPRKIKETGLKINKSVCELRKVLNREPSISELSEYMDIEVEKIIEALDAARPCESILAENQNSVSLLESVADSQESNIETEDKIFLKEILEFLDVRLRQIIFLRFFKDKTQNEVANVMKISQVQVSRLEKKALGILKNKFNFY